MNNNSKIYVSGHQGLVGSSIVRNLKAKGCFNIVTRSRNELELTDQKAVQNFFEKEKPDEVYMAAAKVGGIHANNTYPADFIYDNLMVELNVIHSAFLNGVKKLLFLGSSCIYPKFASQPMKEELLLTGKLELIIGLLCQQIYTGLGTNIFLKIVMLFQLFYLDSIMLKLWILKKCLSGEVEKLSVNFCLSMIWHQLQFS